MTKPKKSTNDDSQIEEIDLSSIDLSSIDLDTISVIDVKKSSPSK
jgi:hypothetical protein